MAEETEAAVRVAAVTVEVAMGEVMVVEARAAKGSA